MAVQKYRDVSEMPPVPRATRPEDIVRRIRALWQRAARLATVGYPPGVYKFRTIEEAQVAREQVRKQRATSAPRQL